MISPANVALIADSGSTKTAWCLTSNPQNIIYTQGINPYQQNEEDICAILQHELMPKLSTVNCHWLSVYFYGAGCTPEKSPMVASTLRQVIGTSGVIRVESDMLGAARGLCGRQPGIVAILGTGSNSCYYDGRSLHPGIPALGYILGDEGSGSHLGKTLLNGLFKGTLPETLKEEFCDEYKLSLPSIIERVYRLPAANAFLASLVPFIAKHRDNPEIHNTLVEVFRLFIERNIANYGHKEMPINCVGGIAYQFEKELKEAAREKDMQIGRILRRPIEKIVQFHLAED